MPLQIHSDQGTNFTSAVFKGLCQILSIDKTQTKLLHSQLDNMVERFNHTILNNLSLLLSQNQHDWDLKLLLFLFTYRSAVHETTAILHHRCCLVMNFIFPVTFYSVVHRIRLHRQRRIFEISSHILKMFTILLRNESAWQQKG